MLSVCDSISDNILKEDLEDATRFFVDKAADYLHATSASKPAYSGLGDALDIIAEDLAMALGASLAEAFAALSASRHGASERDADPNSRCKDVRREQTAGGILGLFL
jgi:gamma-glutamyl:cysteine ligase YbdK (ATP-grasp superfamily)